MLAFSWIGPGFPHSYSFPPTSETGSAIHPPLGHLFIWVSILCPVFKRSGSDRGWLGSPCCHWGVCVWGGVCFILFGFPLVFWNAWWLCTLAQAAGDDTMAWMPKPQRKCIFSQLEAGSPRAGLRRLRGLVGTVFLACRLCLLAVSSWRGDQAQGLWSLFRSCKESIGRLLIPSDRGPTLGTQTPTLPSKGPMFKYIALGLGLQHENLVKGGWGHTNIWSITVSIEGRLGKEG